MKELTRIIELLGEDNEKRLRDGITDILLNQVEKDIDDKYQYNYIIAFDDIFEEVKERIEEEFKEKLAEKYRERMNKEFEKIFPN